MEERNNPRVLATIVFTDAVGFSRLAGVDEARALGLLRRDLDAMRTACESREGRVCNVTGDGLLMMFGSAISAMECALEIQQQIFGRSQTLPAQDVLHHRIGVHLGDVVVEDGNVFGDGVNIASRLEAEARPDAICFSRTVYDVIKNKLTVEVNYLGPRVLKNIADRVMVWQVPPPKDPNADPKESFTDIVPEKPPGATGTKGILLMVVSFVLLLVVVSVAAKAMPHILNGSQTASPGPVSTKPPRTPTPPDQATGTDGGVPAVPTGAETIDQPKFKQLHDHYDFDGLLALLKAAGEEQRSSGPALIQKFEQLAEMRKWLDSAVATVSQENALHVNVDILGSGEEVPCLLYNGNGGTTIDSGSNPQLKSVWDLPPSSIINIATAAAQIPQTPSAAQSWIQTFAQEYNGQPK